MSFLRKILPIKSTLLTQEANDSLRAKENMRILLLGILAAMTFFPGVSWGLDCVKFENMAVKILNQKEDKVNLEWKARVVNKCNKMVSIKVEMQFTDSKEKHLDSSFEPLNLIDLNEVREVQSEKSLPSETYYKIGTYYFKALELPNMAQ